MELSQCLIVSADGKLYYTSSNGQVFEVMGVNVKTGFTLST